MTSIRIAGTGLFSPPEVISNEELVESFNAYVAQFNAEHAGEIEAGTVEPLHPSSVEFILKASGIQNRRVMNKSGILDPERMRPDIPDRPNEQISILAEIAVHAARDALRRADKKPADIDGVIVSCSNMQRAYPAMAIEVQEALGIGGFAFDMNVACASATFGIQVGGDMIKAGNARTLLAVNPEMTTGHLNFRDRDSHFIFGDAATACVLEAHEGDAPANSWEVLGTKLQTQFSNNIRNNFGFLNFAGSGTDGRDRLFVQEGRKVFKDVVPLVSELITGHLADLDMDASAIKRFWLHQANLSMNQLIAKKVLGREASETEAPVILNDYANTSSAGSMIAFHQHSEDLAPGDLGVICAFGAGYSAGSVILRKSA